MSDRLFDEPEGATPLEADEVAGLIPTWVASRSDLNLAEQENVATAVAWASSLTGPRTLDALLTEATIRQIHRRMFGDVWKWAGQYRRRNTNVGVQWPQVPEQVCGLVADVVEQTTDLAALPWDADELAVRFHHRLVTIHPFPNGNGRHARLAADMLAVTLGRPVFTWGAQELGVNGAARSEYFHALRVADLDLDYERLVRLARS